MAASAGVVDLLDQDGELVAAEAGDRVGRAQASFEARGQPPDRSSSPARWPSESLIVLKSSMSMKRTPTGLPLLASAADGEREPVEEEGAVRHSGERVVESLVSDVVESAGVVEGKARVLGEGEKGLLVARGV